MKTCHLQMVCVAFLVLSWASWANDEEIKFASCTINLGGSTKYTVNPDQKTFLALWPWSRNKGLIFSTELPLTEKSSPQKKLKLELRVDGGTVSSTIQEESKQLSYSSFTIYEKKENKKPTGKFQYAYFDKNPRPFPNVTFECRETATKQVLDILDTERVQASLVSQNCTTGFTVTAQSNVEEGDVIRVDSDEYVTVSEEEGRIYKEKGVFYDRDPNTIDATDRWVAKLSPEIPFGPSVSLSCPALNSEMTPGEMDKAEDQTRVQMLEAFKRSLEIPAGDAAKLLSLPTPNCDGEVEAYNSTLNEAEEKRNLAMRKARLKCAIDFCTETQKKRSFNFPYRAFKELVLKIRVDRWKEMRADSLQPFIAVSSDNPPSLHDGVDLHFVKVPKGQRPSARKMLAQIFIDRLRVSQEEAEKMVSDFEKTAQGAKTIADLTSEITKWQNNPDRNRGQRTGVLQQGDFDYVPVLNLEAGVIQDYYEMLNQVKPDEQAQQQSLQNRSNRNKGRTTRQQGNNTRLRVNSGTTNRQTGPICLQGLSGRCYTKKELENNKPNMRDVLLKAQSDQINESFSESSSGTGTGKRLRLNVTVPAGIDCQSMDVDDWKGYVYKSNELYLKSVVSQFSGSIWNPGNYPDSDDQKKCIEKYGVDRKYACRWYATCRMGQRPGGVPATIDIDSLYREKDREDAQDYIKAKSKAIPNGGDLDGDLEFIPFGPEWKEMRAKYMSCYNKCKSYSAENEINNCRRTQCQDLRLDQDRIDLMLTRSHGFNTVAEFQSFRDSNPQYRKWYDNLVSATGNSENFYQYMQGGLVDEGLYIIVPPGNKISSPNEGIVPTENVFRQGNERAYGLNYLQQVEADQRMRQFLRNTNPLLRGMYALGLENTSWGRTLENSNAEFNRGVIEYVQSWTSKPLESLFQMLSTDEGQSTIRAFSCLQSIMPGTGLLVAPLSLPTCFNGANNKQQMMDASVAVSKFNQRLSRSLERPDSLYCAQTDLTCLETWARMAPAFMGDTAIMLLSAPLGPAGMIGSGLLISARQASDAYYSTVQMMLQQNKMTWDQLADKIKYCKTTAECEKYAGLKNTIISAAVKNGMITFAVTSAATLAGMKAQQMVATKIMGAELSTLNTSILGKTSTSAVTQMTERQIAVRALIGEIAGGVPINLSQATVDLVRQCKMFNQCDDASFTSAMITSMVMMAPTSVAPGVYRVVTAGTKPMTPAQLNIRPDFESVIARQTKLDEVRNKTNFTPSDLDGTEGAVRYVIKNGNTEPQVLLKTSDGYGWFDVDRAVIKMDMERNPQNFKNVPPVEPNVKIKSVRDLVSVKPVKLTNVNSNDAISRQTTDFKGQAEQIKSQKTTVSSRDQIEGPLDLSNTKAVAEVFGTGAKPKQAYVDAYNLLHDTEGFANFMDEVAREALDLQAKKSVTVKDGKPNQEFFLAALQKRMEAIGWKFPLTSVDQLNWNLMQQAVADGKGFIYNKNNSTKATLIQMAYLLDKMGPEAFKRFMSETRTVEDVQNLASILDQPAVSTTTKKVGGTTTVKDGQTLVIGGYTDSVSQPKPYNRFTSPKRVDEVVRIYTNSDDSSVMNPTQTRDNPSQQKRQSQNRFLDDDLMRNISESTDQRVRDAYERYKKIKEGGGACSL